MRCSIRLLRCVVSWLTGSGGDGVGIKVTGVRKLQQAITNGTGRFDKETIAVLRRAAVKVRRRQKELAPTDEGDLKRSITYRIRGSRWRRVAEIGPKLSEMYPAYQEYGTARMEANPYVQPSMEGMADELADALDGLVGKVIR